MADNLLDKASILLTPTAYNDGSMLSIKPENGDGDFDFSRNSAATRVNAQGLVENVQIISSELVLNGDFSNGSTDWTIENTWTIGDGVANGNGANGNTEELVQSLSFDSSKKYKISYQILNYVSGSVRYSLSGGGGYNGQNKSANGTYVDIVNTGASHNQIKFFGLNFNGSISNISVKEITDDTNLPRIDYTDGCGSWLLEGQSTNTVPYSSDFSQWTWGGDSNANNTTRVDNQSSPDGETNAALFTRNAGTGGFFSPTNLSVVLNQTYTYSLFVKKGTSSTIELRNVSNSPQSIVTYNIDTDTFTQEFNASGKAVDYGNGWYRIAMTFEHLNTSGTSAQIRHTLEDGESIYVFGSQFENLSYATSYIPTDGAANTRLQDIATNSGNASLINSTEGVLYAEMAALADDGTNRGIALSDGTTSNRVNILFGTGLNKIRAIVKSNGSTSFDNEYTVTSTLNYHKVAIKYKENDFALWIDGIERFTDTSGAAPIGLDRITFDTGNGTLNFYGKAKALVVFPILTDAELQSLTTI